MKKITYLSLILFLWIACKKEENTPPDSTNSNNGIPPITDTSGTLTLKFENYAGSTPLVLNSGEYLNQNGDTFKVSLFSYYISNIQLIAADSSVYTETESYHLVQSDLNSSLQFTLNKVARRNYVALRFMIGVDSLRNVSGAQTGALDPANGMFWSWNSGYIMTKIEGTSPQSGQASKLLKFHVGGFSGINNSLKRVRLNFQNSATVTATIVPQVTLKADLLEWFTNPNLIDFSTLHTVHMPGASAKLVADNYADMFSILSVQN